MLERRRAHRLPVSLEIEVKRVGWATCAATEISVRGLLVLSPEGLQPNQLIQLRIPDAPGYPPITMLAKAVRPVPASTDPEDKRLLGTALEFFCLKGEPLRRWLNLLNTPRESTRPQRLNLATLNPEAKTNQTHPQFQGPELRAATY